MLRTSRSLFNVASRVPSLALVTRPIPRLASVNLPSTSRIVRFSSERKPDTSNEPAHRTHEEKLAQQTLKSDPSAVTTESSTRHVFEGSQGTISEEHDMMGELKHDVGAIKDAFRFKDVPRESHIIGLVGTIPYVGTSLSTLYLSWDLNQKLPTGSSFYDAISTDHETARYLLDVIEPIQLGYGAFILTYLGVVHWAWEYAEKQPNPDRTRFRYTVGLIAPIVAWPTLFMSVEYALTAQFLAFVGLYYADTRASLRGWAPYWYGTYRFLLTAMVGLAIFISLVGRAQIGQSHALSSQGLERRMSTSGIADRETDWVQLEKEEKERIKKEKKAEKKKEEKEEQEKKQKEALSKAGYKEAEDGDEAKEEQDEKDDGSNTDEQSSDEGKSENDTNKGDKEKNSDTKKDDGANEEGGDKEQGSQN